VATATEIFDYLRLLYARCGTTHCISCDGIVRRDTVDEIAAAVLALGEGTRLHAIFPVEKQEAAGQPEQTAKPAKRGRKPSKKAAESALTDGLRERFTDLRKRGFNRLYQNGSIYEFSTPESLLELDLTQPIFVLVDRIVVSPENRARIVDAAEIGYREAGEILYEIVPRPGETEPSFPGQFAEGSLWTQRQRLRFSMAFECKSCHRVYREPEPRLFSFNNPFGACPRCQGFGNTVDFDLDLIIPDKSKTLDEGAIDPWNRPKYRSYFTELKKAARTRSIPVETPWYDLTQEQQDFVLDGSGAFPGVRGFFALLERKKYKLHVRVMLSKYRGYALCPDCKGQRLRAEARAVRLGGKNICEASALTIRAANEFFSSLTLTPMQAEIAGSILTEVQQRLHFLDAVGLEYLTLPAGFDAFGWRIATDSARHLTGLSAGGRTLCAR
jgi:excinuclease ABC subunit A